MYEVIWSWFEDAYIVRPVNVNSSVKPLLIGSHDECVAHIRNNTSR